MCLAAKGETTRSFKHVKDSHHTIEGSDGGIRTDFAGAEAVEPQPAEGRDATQRHKGLSLSKHVSRHTLNFVEGHALRAVDCEGPR
jgi:hypothetical protein